MKRTSCFLKKFAALALLCCLVLFAQTAGALEVQPGQLALEVAEEEAAPGKTFETRLRFIPDEARILDSYRLEISYDPQVLEFASRKVISDHFNGKFEMIQEGNLLSVIYLAEYDDVMREPVDMAILRFKTLDNSFSGTTALTLRNKLTGEEENWSLKFTSGDLAGSAVKTTVTKASSKTASSKASSSKSGTKSSKGAEDEVSSSILVVGGNHRESNVQSNLPVALQTVLLAAFVVILAAIVAVVVKNRKKVQNSGEKGQQMGKRTCKKRRFII